MKTKPNAFPSLKQIPQSRTAKTSRGAKHHQAAAIATLAIALCVAPIHAQVIPGLIAWWPGEGTGDDVIGTNNVTLLSGCSYAAGIAGHGFRFDENNQGSSSCSESLTGASNSFAIEFWAYPMAGRASTPEADSDASGIGGQRYAIAPEYGGGVGVSIGTNGVSVFEHSMNYLPSLLVYDAPINGWTHIAVVYRNCRPELFINGTLVRTGLTSQNSAVFPSKTFGDNLGYGPYVGSLDEIGIYDRALSPPEILAIYQSSGSIKYPSDVIWVNSLQRPLWVHENDKTESIDVVLLRKSNLPEKIVTVDYVTSDGSAHAGEDYVAASGTLHFAVGETHKQIEISILNDIVAEGQEQFEVILTRPSEGILLGHSNLVIMLSDDEPFYVSAANQTPAYPYRTWATAATNIQDAVDAACRGGLVLVTNGVYATGGWTNEWGWIESRVTVTNTVRLESVNGPLVTTIVGSVVLTNDLGEEVARDGGRCVYLGSDSVLNGFTLTNGFSRDSGGFFQFGGGVWAESSAVLTNCIVAGNSAFFGAPAKGGGVCGGTLYACTLINNHAYSGSESVFTYAGGGGAYGSILYNCTISDCSSQQFGGAVDNCELYNCTLIGNTAGEGGGASDSTLHDCTLTINSARDGGGAQGSRLYNCTLASNSAWQAGGGAYASTLYNCLLAGNATLAAGGGACESSLFNCTVVSNSADEGFGGGVIGCEVYNCILYYNSATNGANHFAGVAAFGWGFEVSTPTLLNYCCTTPMPTNGIGNITNTPLFVDAAAGDFRLREGSPCIDAGTNLVGFTMSVTNESGEVTVFTYHHDATDMLGHTRFLDGNYDGTVAWDMGAYEFNPYRFTPTMQMGAEGFQFTVRGEPGRSVRIERSRDLIHWEYAGQVPIPATGQTLIDPAATSEPRLFYRAQRVP